MGKQQRFSRRDFLKFGAVDSEAKVWVNGQYVGEHVEDIPLLRWISHRL